MPTDNFEIASDQLEIAFRFRRLYDGTPLRIRLSVENRILATRLIGRPPLNDDDILQIFREARNLIWESQKKPRHEGNPLLPYMPLLLEITHPFYLARETMQREAHRIGFYENER